MTEVDIPDALVCSLFIHDSNCDANKRIEVVRQERDIIFNLLSRRSQDRN